MIYSDFEIMHGNKTTGITQPLTLQVGALTLHFAVQNSSRYLLGYRWRRESPQALPLLALLQLQNSLRRFGGPPSLPHITLLTVTIFKLQITLTVST